MQEADDREVVQTLCEKDPRYAPGAYALIRETLDFTVQMVGREARGPRRHVSAAELLEGLRVYVLQEYGPMARTVLATWGIRRTEDVGNVVFNLVASGKLGKTEEDSIDDFGGGYDFAEAFDRPFIPARPMARRTREPRPLRRDRGGTPSCASLSTPEPGDDHA